MLDDDDAQHDKTMANFMRQYVEAHKRDPKRTTIEEVERFFLEKIRAVRLKERQLHEKAAEASHNAGMPQLQDVMLMPFKMSMQMMELWMQFLSAEMVNRKRW